MKRCPDELVKTCSRLESGLRLGPDAIRPCVFSVFESPIYWEAESVPSTITKLDIVNKRKMLFEQLNDDHSEIACKKCLKVEVKKFSEVTFDKLGFIDLAHYSYCNLRCNYCAFTQNDSFHKEKYDGLKVLNQFDQDHVEFDASVDFNGGEPSLLPNLDEYLETFRKKGIRIRLYTNAIRYSASIENALRDGTIAWLIISVDAGTAATFNKTKLRDVYKIVLDNIAKYTQAVDTPKSGQVASKYIFTHSNCGDADIDGFVRDMVRVKPHQIWLLYDFQDIDQFSKEDFSARIQAYAKMYTAFLKKGITPSHFYESFLDPVCDESRELVTKTKTAIELLTHQKQLKPTLIYPHRVISKKQLEQFLVSTDNLNLIIAPANIMTTKLLSEIKIKNHEIIIGDRSVQKENKKIGGITIKHYSDLEHEEHTHLIVTSKYHFSAITKEISYYLNLNNISILLIDDFGHKSL